MLSGAHGDYAFDKLYLYFPLKCPQTFSFLLKCQLTVIIITL